MKSRIQVKVRIDLPNGQEKLESSQFVLSILMQKLCEVINIHFNLSVPLLSLFLVFSFLRI